ncbi:MAG: carboxypeptidase regulatory-like domain-containing protein [Acidobacteriota bacterium]
MKLIRTLAIIAVFVLASVGVYAQGSVTGTLSGTVTSQGAPLPGVTVTITSPNLQGSRNSISGDGGGYNFGGLPPGMYTVTFELAGLQTVTKTQNVAVANSSKVDADLTVATVSEAITITASSPSVLDSPQISSNFQQDAIEKLPINRDPLSVAALAPGVLADAGQSGTSIGTLSANQVQISGSPGYDNLIMVNGVVITENLRSQAGPLFIEDAIQETTVLTGAISAEFGRFTGGVINSITKSGGNQFSGSVRDNLTNSAWGALVPTQTVRTDKVNHQYEGTLGGFIVRDRLWFFGAGRQQKKTADFATVLPPGTTGASPLPYTRLDDEKRYEVKLTGQITPKHSLIVSYLDKKRDLTNTRFTNSIYDLDSLTTQGTPETLASAFYNGVITSNFLLEGQYSKRTLKFVNSGSKFTDLILGTLMRDSSNGNARFNSPTFCGVCDTERRDNHSILAKGSYFLSTPSFGNHSFVIGGEDFHENRYANNHQSGSDFRVNVSSVRLINGVLYPTIDDSSASYIRWTPIFVGANENNLDVKSVFLNDKWDFNSHFTFNLGLRYDKNHSEDGQGVVASDDSAVSPRLTAIYDVMGNGKHRFQASYNKYVSRVIDGPGTANDASGTPGSIDFQYRGPVINPAGTPVNQLVDDHTALQMLFAWFNANGGTSNLDLLHPTGARSVPGFDYFFEGSLKSPSVNEYAAGYGVQLGQSGYAKVDYIYRKWQDFYGLTVTQATGTITDQLGITHDRGIIDNTNDIQRNYRGLQFQAGFRPSRFNVGTSYTYAKLRGNDETETVTSGAFANIPLDSYYPEYAGYARRLPTGYIDNFDIRHQLKLWAGYDVPMPASFGSLNATILHSYHSGVAYSAAGLISVTNYAGAPDIPAYEQSLLGVQNYYFSDRGALRADAVNRTDLALNYVFPIGKVQLFATGELLNVFNNDGVEDLNFIQKSVRTNRNSNCVQASNGPTPGARCLRFNPFTETPVEGVHYQLAPGFGGPTNFQAYQLPRTYRFSAGIRF